MFENYETNPTTEGTIDALDEMVELNCFGAASAVIAVSGTFTGVLSITGSGEPANGGTQGGRLVFKSGVGGGGVASNAKIAVSFVWYEEPVH